MPSHPVPAVAVTPTNPPSRLSAPPLNSKQIALLDRNERSIIGPKTAAGLRTWIADAEAFEATLELPTRDRIENLIGLLSTATAVRHTSVEEAKAALDLYWRALRIVPLADLNACFDDLLRRSTFLPKPAEIYAAANRITTLRRYRISRARHLVWLHEQEWTPPIDNPVTPEDIAAIKAEVAAKFASQRGSEPDHPDTV